MIRRLKSEVLDQLPSKTRKRVHIELDPAKMKILYEEMEKVGFKDIEELLDRMEDSNIDLSKVVVKKNKKKIDVKKFILF